MQAVLLAEPSAVLVKALAERVSKKPVDPPGLTDHRWLYAPPELVQQRIQESIDYRKAHGGGGWVILASGDPIGLITVLVEDTVAETFSFICADAQNRGIATAARAGVLTLLANDPDVRRVASTARPASPSSAVSRRLGYSFVGMEVRHHPDHGDVVLERYEVALGNWRPPKGVTPARLAPNSELPPGNCGLTLPSS